MLRRTDDASFAVELVVNIMQNTAMVNVMYVEPNEGTDLDVGMDEDCVAGNFINGVHFSMAETESSGTQIVEAIFDRRPELSETSLLPQAGNLLYIPVTINDIDGSTLVVCEATNTFISRKFVTRKQYTDYKNIRGKSRLVREKLWRSGKELSASLSRVKSSPDVIDIPDGHELMIGLCSFNDFGYKIEGIQRKPPLCDNHGNPEHTSSHRRTSYCVLSRG